MRYHYRVTYDDGFSTPHVYYSKLTNALLGTCKMLCNGGHEDVVVEKLVKPGKWKTIRHFMR